MKHSTNPAMWIAFAALAGGVIFVAFSAYKSVAVRKIENNPCAQLSRVVARDLNKPGYEEIIEARCNQFLTK